MRSVTSEENSISWVRTSRMIATRSAGASSAWSASAVSSSMFVRMLVSGVRSSCPASATNRACRVRDTRDRVEQVVEGHRRGGRARRRAPPGHGGAGRPRPRAARPRPSARAPAPPRPAPPADRRRRPPSTASTPHATQRQGQRAARICSVAGHRPPDEQRAVPGAARDRGRPAPGRARPRCRCWPECVVGHPGSPAATAASPRAAPGTPVAPVPPRSTWPVGRDRPRPRCRRSRLGAVGAHEPLQRRRVRVPGPACGDRGRPRRCQEGGRRPR